MILSNWDLFDSAQAYHSNRTTLGNSPPATHTAINSTSEEESPARLSDYLPRIDPATQEQYRLAWTATPTGEIENGNAGARGSLGDIPLVDVGSLNPIERRQNTPLADSDPDVRNHNRRAPRPVSSLRRMTSEEKRRFWRESSDLENESGST